MDGITEEMESTSSLDERRKTPCLCETPSGSLIRSEFESLLSESSEDEEAENRRGKATKEKEENAERTDFSQQRRSEVPPSGSRTARDVAVGASEDAEEIVLSVIWSNDRLGAAYYDVVGSELFVMDDAHEDVSCFDLTKALYRQCQPRYVVTLGGAASAFSNVLKKLVIENTSNASNESRGSFVSRESGGRPGVALKTVSRKDHDYERCYHRVRCLRLEGEPENASGVERFAYLNTILNFKCHSMIHALGSLLLFLDEHWNGIALDPAGRPSFLCLNYVSLRDLVTVDEDTYESLGILRSRYHPSFFKFGKATGKSQQAASLFSFLDRCRSGPGVRFLWKTLQHPTRNREVLERRLDAIEFFMDPENQSVVEYLSSCLRHVRRPTNGILGSDAAARARPSDWYKLHKTVSNVIGIADACQRHGEKIELFRRIADSVNSETRYVKYFVEYALDLDASRRENAFVVRPNVDPVLDELNRAKSALPDLLTEMGEKDMREHLPASVTGCNMVYLPNIGYLLAINEWNPTPPEDATFPRLEFKFTINGVRYYKSPSARDLDNVVGDVVLRISKRTSRVLAKLIGYANKQAGAILTAIRFCAELDTLLAFYAVARDHDYARPRLVESRILEVNEGRHPLRECQTTFVSNDVRSGNGGSLVKVLTGPNSCGKSVYLKQIGLIAFMAHIGSYVPAKSATIGLLARIFAQTSNAGSIALNASSFLQDLRQINVALRTATADSLVLIDEFGRGTSEVSGTSLLAAVLGDFLERGADRCPHVFVATHVHRAFSLMAQTPLIEARTFEYVVNDDESLAFLYRLTSGNATRSFAHCVARSAELDEDVVKRSLEVFERIKEGALPSKLPEAERADRATRIVERLTNTDNLNFDLQDLESYVRRAVIPKK